MLSTRYSSPSQYSTVGPGRANMIGPSALVAHTFPTSECDNRQSRCDLGEDDASPSVSTMSTSAQKHLGNTFV